MHWGFTTVPAIDAVVEATVPSTKAAVDIAVPVAEKTEQPIKDNHTTSVSTIDKTKDWPFK